MLVIKDAPELVQAYEANIRMHAGHSHPYLRQAAAGPSGTSPAVVSGHGEVSHTGAFATPICRATDCRLRQALESGKKAKIPLIGAVCLLTKGVLVRVRRVTGDRFPLDRPTLLRRLGRAQFFDSAPVFHAVSQHDNSDCRV